MHTVVEVSRISRSLKALCDANRIRILEDNIRQLIEQEMARRDAHVVRDLRRLRAKAIKFEAHGDDSVIVRPD